MKHNKGKKVEVLKKKYAAVKQKIQSSPLFSGDPERLVWEHNNANADALVAQYDRAWNNLIREGIPVRHVLGEAIAAHESASLDGIISCMPKTFTWVSGYHALRKTCAFGAQAGLQIRQPTLFLDGQIIHRPLTLGEDLRARIADARAHDNDVTQAPSWNIWNDSCTAIIYGDDGKFKVQKISRDLLNLPPYFWQRSIQARYDIIRGVDVAEFNRRDVKYNTLLTQEEVLQHPFWQFVADGNIDVLREYTQLQWAGKKAGYKGMAIWIRDSSQRGELQALCVYNHNSDSNADGYNGLNGNGSFLRVS